MRKKKAAKRLAWKKRRLPQIGDLVHAWEVTHPHEWAGTTDEGYVLGYVVKMGPLADEMRVSADHLGEGLRCRRDTAIVIKPREAKVRYFVHEIHQRDNAEVLRRKHGPFAGPFSARISMKALGEDRCSTYRLRTTTGKDALRVMASETENFRVLMSVAHELDLLLAHRVPGLRP